MLVITTALTLLGICCYRREARWAESDYMASAVLLYYILNVLLTRF